MTIFAQRAYLQDGWAKDVRITLRAEEIAHIQTQTAPKPEDIRVDTLLPALSNLHSHSFQRAMAGMTEFRTAGRESFWTWRDLMYRFLDHLTPEEIGAIARLAFMEMQEAGFAAVGEFHYIHHAPGGQFYDNPAELSDQILQAASDTGIGLTHLPVLYSYGDVGQKPLTGGQLRFGHKVDQYIELIDRCQDMVKQLNADTRLGIAPHSLRATSPSDLARVSSLQAQGPIHIHIAEQVKEVESVKAALGARPVEWLLHNAEVDARWCLIHATHMTDEETQGIAQSGAIAGLCPVTEANLGDGIFNGPAYIENGGKFGIGTDSNINISLCEELRTLEYSQRLKHQQRNVLAAGHGSTGETLYTNAALGGAQALSRNAGILGEGKLADMVAIDSTAPALCMLRDDQLLDGLVFAAKDKVVTDVWSGGRHQVHGGHHVAQEEILSQYREAMRKLMATLNK
ncbi:formimidoylglutamate deiminase [Roseobacter sp. EG26]|uniref:formimidoylglutamate deiminase n=1 Tax=Roseobacter sp. EG26 TaxID=3412477 RepID=UPI003CE58019